MQAKKIPSGKWRARAYNKYTGSTKSFTADSKKEAEMLARAYEFTITEATNSTVQEACEMYIINRQSILSPNTIKDYMCTTKHHLDGIKTRKVDTITSQTLQAWVNCLCEELSPKSVKNIYGFVVSAICALNPNKKFKVNLPKKEKKDLKMPSEQDIKNLLQFVQGTDMECPVKLAVMCCMRRGEIASLLHHPECVGSDSVTVKYNMIKSKGEWIEKAPKTYTSYRTIPCPPELIDLIKEAPKLNSGEITDRWIKKIQKSGFKFRFHDLRHFSASSMLTIMPTIDVEKFGGWRHGSSVLQDIYAYNIDESLKNSASKWREKIKEF